MAIVLKGRVGQEDKFVYKYLPRNLAVHIITPLIYLLFVVQYNMGTATYFITLVKSIIVLSHICLCDFVVNIAFVFMNYLLGPFGLQWSLKDKKCR